ncbi:MAG: hypothetical protein JWL90_334 [Chthoniobacteraceae bacterium]|nr:hypothetical protein [Chthoniobacteraceae bacterium]
MGWEGYKQGVYHKAKELLAARRWNVRSFGTGDILAAVINAIEIKDWNGERNNLVEWERKGRPPESVTHFKLLEAVQSAPARRAADEALYRMYAKQADPAECFAELTTLFGAHYDLIAYLFFLRDWNKYMPVRPTVFPQAFEIFGVPLTMRSRCSWENYQEYLSRLREVLRHLRELELPGVVSLLDAHSFCWMLVKLPPARSKNERQAAVQPLMPEAGELPSPAKGNSGFTQAELDEALREQRRLGTEAQLLVLNAEQARLRKQGQRELAEKVTDVSDNTSLGYDIESFTNEGQPKRIEVKATAHRGGDLRFFLSENERRCSQDLEGYTFALVTGVRTTAPRIYEFHGRELPKKSLHPVNFEVRLKCPQGA